LHAASVLAQPGARSITSERGLLRRSLAIRVRFWPA
jgi:hypothetical protein